jgi:mannose-1-phosphate guanylyltransferase
MEKALNRIVIPVDLGWSDIGSWDAIYDISEKDADQNSLPEKNLTIKSSNNFVRSDKLIALVGVKNLIVIETEDALLIADKNNSQDIRSVVDKLKKTNKEEYL